MSKRLFVAMLVVAVTCLLLSPAIALAAGSGPQDTMAPVGTWTAIDKGQRHWYAFEYDGEGDAIEVSMTAEPSAGAMFHVLTNAQVQAWQQDGDLEGCGCGTENENMAADSFWTGNFNSAGTYYIVVEHSGVHDGLVDYALEASGKGVTTTSPAVVRVEVVAAPAAAAAPTEAAEAEMTMETGEWMPLHAGEDHWFEFRYEGDEAISVMLDAEPDCAVTFSVYTAEQLRRYALGEDIEPVGQGSENEFLAGDLSWTGSFPGSGTFYVKVEHKGTGISDCKLDVSGNVF